VAGAGADRRPSEMSFRSLSIVAAWPSDEAVPNQDAFGLR